MTAARSVNPLYLPVRMIVRTLCSNSLQHLHSQCDLLVPRTVPALLWPCASRRTFHFSARPASILFSHWHSPGPCHIALQCRGLRIAPSGTAPASSVLCRTQGWRQTGLGQTGLGQGLLDQTPCLHRLGGRHKSGGRNSKSQDSDDELEDEELDDDDYEAPPSFKKKKIHLKSLRADSVISSGLDISRNRVDETFYGSQLRLNGEKLLKKSKQMEEGDYVDVVVDRSSENDQVMVKRVKVIHVSSERTSTDKRLVTVKVWKKAFPVEDQTKSFHK